MDYLIVLRLEVQNQVACRVGSVRLGWGNAPCLSPSCWGLLATSVFLRDELAELLNDIIPVNLVIETQDCPSQTGAPVTSPVLCYAWKNVLHLLKYLSSILLFPKEGKSFVSGCKSLF